jgi:hypothetical protein
LDDDLAYAMDAMVAQARGLGEAFKEAYEWAKLFGGAVESAAYFVGGLAQRAGFRFVGSSEVNANRRDTHDYPKGVWTLPPSYAQGDNDRAKYAAIGESDRMTLKFVKPGS